MRTIIIEDEPHALAFLRDGLAENCPDIEIEGTAASVAVAVQILRERQPDLVFLDIKLGSGSGFEILEKLGVFDFEIIYTTAYYGEAEVAERMHRFHAAALLPKPFTSAKLREAVGTARKNFREKMAARSSDIGKRQENLRIVLRNQGDFSFVSLRDILFCQSDRACVEFHLRGGTRKAVTKSLTETEVLLHDNGFLRIHNSHIVNTLCVKNYLPGAKGGSVVLENGAELEISETYREAFKKWLWSANLNFGL